MQRTALRLVVVEAPEEGCATPPSRREGSMRCTYRGAEDDFFCWKFQLWYPSLDCAYRVRHRTCAPCSDCAQGRRNLERRSEDLDRRRFIGDPEPLS